MMDKENNKTLANNILVFSPFKSGPSFKSFKNSVQTNNDVANNTNTLICAKFQESLHFELGQIPVNGTKISSFYLKNPNLNKSVKVSIDKYDEKMDLSISLGENNQTIDIAPSETLKGIITWKPIHDATMREIVYLKLDDKASLQIIVYGTAGTGQNESKSLTTEDKINRIKNFSKETSERRNTLSSYSTNPSKLNQNGEGLEVINSNKVNKSVKANAKRLSVCDQVKPKCQNTFLFDTKWAEKQSNSFKDWINFTFSKSQEVILTDNDDFKELNNDLDSSFNSIKGTQMDENSQSYANNLKILIQRRIDAKIRRAAMHIYNQDSFNSITSLIEDEVIENKLIMRDDRDIHADIGMQESLLSILFSYEYPWLRIGLEIVFGKIISLQRNKNKNSSVEGMPCMSGCSKWKNTLKAFIFENLFSNSDITDQFCKQKLLYIAQEKKMKEMLRKHMLQKVLILVLFLDRARTSYLLPKSTLFSKDSLYKSSKDIVAAFCRSFLRGEGDIIRHLSLLGYNLQFSQTFVHEFDFNVKNLALDLRDGVRIARLFELLTRSTTITTQLRVPAVSRLQKLHNVNLILDKLYGQSEKKPEAKSIVDGNRDITLMFLWKLLYTFELKMMITPDKVLQEVQMIQMNDNWRRSIYSSDDVKHLAVKVPVLENGKIKKVNSSSIDKSVSSSSDSIDDESLTFALQQWCQAIAARYDVPVFDLTTCLSDGRALCLLIHYYHPAILPTKLIKKTTANLMEAYMTGDSFDSYMETNPTFSSSELNQAICNERKNFALLKKACNCIGGIPLMLPEFDSKNVPEEKSMVVFLGYLFSRLIESSQEVTAVIRIQRALRRCFPMMKSHYENKKALIKTVDVVTKDPIIKTENDSILKMPVTVSVSLHFAADIIKRNMKQFVIKKRLHLLQSEIVNENLIETEEYHNIDCNSFEESFKDESEHILSENMFNSHSYKEWVEEVESGDNIRADLEIKLSIEEIARIKAENEIQEALAKNKELEEKLQHEELITLSIAEKLSEEAKAREKAECEAKLELEKRLLMTLELEIAKESLHDAMLHEELKVKEAQELYESSKHENSQFHSQIEVLAQCEKEARSIAEEKIRIETELRMNAEERIKELEYERELEKQRIVVAEQEKIEITTALESKWEEEHRQRQEELRIIAEDAELLKVEQAARFLSEENARKEREAREALELEMQEEKEARRQAEMRLKAFEDAILAEKIELQRILEETKRLAIQSFNAATTIQSKWRSFVVIKKMKMVLTGVTLMQSVFRGYADRKKSLRLLISIRILQSLWRRKQCNKILEKMNTASKCIQFFWKGYVDRKFFNNLKSSTRVIQAKWKSYYYSTKFKICKFMATKIQSQYRRVLCVKYTKKLISSLVKIQSFMRSCIAKNLLIFKLHNIKVIQKYWRKSINIQKNKAELNKMKKMEHLQNARHIVAHSVVIRFLKKVSNYLKQKKSIRKISKWFLSRLPYIRVKKLLRGFHRLQAVFRSKKVQKTSNKKVTELLKRIKAAEEKAKQDPTLMIGRQTSHALSVLQNGKMISHILKACQTLELSTQLSKRCCEAFAHAKAANILFALLRSCNRSTPHQELLRIALVVLLNVARHDSLATFVSIAEDAADALVDLMQMFRDKKSIFILAAELLTRLVNASENVKEICNSPIYRKRLEGIQHIIERKNRLEVRVRSISVNMHGAETTDKPADEFIQYKGKNYQSIEPIVCIQHLMRLLNE